MNPATEKLKKCILDEFKVYNNLAPKLALLAYTVYFFGEVLYKLMTIALFELVIVDIVSSALKTACIFGALGYLVGRISSARLQSNQLQVLQKERVKRRKALKKQLQVKREALNKMEAMMS